MPYCICLRQKAVDSFGFYLLIFMSFEVFSEIRGFYKEFKHLAIFRVAFYFAGSLIVIVVIYSTIKFFIDSHDGKHVKLFYGLLENNIPQQPDTIVKIITSKPEPVQQPQQEKDKLIVSPISKSRPSKPKPDALIENQVIISGKDNHLVSGNGNIVGINGDIINGIKQRHLTYELLVEIEKKIPDKSSNIKIWTSGGKEGYNFSNEIYTALMQRGYKSISGTTWMDPSGFDKVDVLFENDIWQIRVHPASNVE